MNPFPPTSNAPYIIAIVIMAIGAIIGSVAIEVLRPNQDNSTLIGLIFGFLTPTTVSILTFMKSQETHSAVNGRLTNFIDTATSAATAQGILRGTQEANIRTDQLNEFNKSGTIVSGTIGTLY